jgi:hypothetical protein
MNEEIEERQEKGMIYRSKVRRHERRKTRLIIGA